MWLDALLCLYNLSGIVDYPTRIQNKSSTAIDNISIGTFKISNYSISSLFNDLSDHDAQLVMIKDINFKMQNYHIHTIRNINKYSMTEFQIKLSYESWEDFFYNDHNKDVNSSLNTYLRIFYSSFPGVKLNENLIIIHGLQQAKKSLVFIK